MKNICVFTGSRAEYGLLSKLINLFEKDNSINLTLVVSGTHLSQDFGYTVESIEKEFFGKIKKIHLPLEKGLSLACITAFAIKEYSFFLENNKFDLLVLLGDRYECFAMASAAFLSYVPIAHIHGGETTLGAIDNSLRHSISLMSKYHFVSCEEHLSKVISLGASKDYSLIVGPMVIDSLLVERKINNHYFELQTKYIFGEKNILLSFHPETLKKDFGLQIFENILLCLSEIIINGKSVVNVLASYPNADTSGFQIKKRLEEFADNHKNFFLIPSLGHDLYLYALEKFDCLIGNSSSGLIEAPLIGIPVINVGDRQKGRKSFGNVINITGSSSEISSNLKAVLEKPKLKKSSVHLKSLKSPSELISCFLSSIE
tara:strand:+ start:410 stop:1528 length:1119 start_codon:yes stop_codon:yes gene_type:complete